LIEISVALVASQRNVDDWPRWIVDGSATNDEIAGLAGGGGGAGSSCFGGGGGGGGATFFLHPVAAKNSVSPKNIMLIFLMFIILIMNLALYSTFKCTPSRIPISTPAEDFCRVW
jgi:hypothetical protein